MADRVLFGITQSIIGTLGSLAREELGQPWGINFQLEQLSDTMSTIESVLVDAEKKMVQSDQVKSWLQRLENALYEADDLVDDFNTKALRRSLRGRDGYQKGKKVRIFLSSSNRLVSRVKMGRKLKKIRQSLDRLRNDRSFYLVERLDDNFNQEEPLRERETHSYVDESDVIGRDYDCMEVIRLLVDPKFEETNINNVPVVIPIVGLGGIGKTTLAKLVFNHYIVETHFDLKIWVYVSEDFNFKQVIKKIIKSASTNSYGDLENLEMDELQKCLRNQVLCGKRYLIVLDDVWNEDFEKWGMLKQLLVCGKRGSRMLVTTRTETVARITSEVAPWMLSGLNDEQSWSLFERIAFRRGHEPRNLRMERIGREIVEKCRGHPLSIKVIGGLIQFKESGNEWERIKNSKMYGNTIRETIMLSYKNLSPNLKNCFAYCSLFPRDHEFDVQNLINLWMAQGFVRCSPQKDGPEDDGYDYFMDLLCRNFFQDPIKDDWGIIRRCTIFDLIHFLATSVSRQSVKIFDDDSQFPDSLYHLPRHISFDMKLFDLKFPSSLVKKFKNSTTRSLIFHKKSTSDTYPSFPLDKFESKQKWSNCNAIFSHLKFLRMLDLKKLNLDSLPNSLGKLKHLRYLDLSENKIKKLPTSTTKLQNLQTLILSYCQKLRRLPRDMKKLVSLIHLDIDGCISLIDMPRGLGELTSLQTLNGFVATASMHSSASGLYELSNLNNLRGELVIRGLGHGKDAASDSEAANLKEKEHLLWLRLEWRFEEHNANGLNPEDNFIKYEEMILNNMQPHSALRSLEVKNYMGVTFSNWLSSLTNLVQLNLRSCTKCQHLPALDQLPCLMEVTFHSLTALEYVVSFSDSSTAPSSSFFRSLRRLNIQDCRNLKGWWRKSSSTRRDIDDEKEISAMSSMTSISHQRQTSLFPCLADLNICNCPNLTSMPLFPYLETLHLTNTSSKPLQQTIMAGNIDSCIASSASTSTSLPSSSYFSSLSRLNNMSIVQVEDVESLPNSIENLLSLVSLKIEDCPNLVSLPEGLGGLLSLKSLHILLCPKLGSLPEEMGNLSSLQSFEIVGCPSLESLPDSMSNLSIQYNISECPNLLSLPKKLGKQNSQ